MIRLIPRYIRVALLSAIEDEFDGLDATSLDSIKALVLARVSRLLYL